MLLHILLGPIISQDGPLALNSNPLSGFLNLGR